MGNNEENRNVTVDSCDEGVEIRKGNERTYADIVKGKPQNNRRTKQVRFNTSTH